MMEITGIIKEVSEKIYAKNGNAFYKVKFNCFLNETGLMFTEEQLSVNDKIVYTRSQNELTRAIHYKLIRKEERVYRGVVIGLELKHTTVFGMREFEVSFFNGKAIFQISSKRNMPIHVGQTINFTGSFYGNSFIIDELKDEVIDLPKGNGFTQVELNKMMTPHQANEIML